MAEKTPLDKVLLNVDRIDRVHKYFKSIGSTDEQAATAAAAHADKFKYDGAVLTFNGTPVADADSGVREWFTENGLSFLLPAANATNKNAPTIDPALVESARTNLTSRGALYRLLGSAEAVDAALAGNTGDTPGSISVVEAPVKVPALKDGKTNPWAPDTVDGEGRPAWSLAARRRQTDVVKSLGPAKASEIAKAANSFLGASRPGAVNMTSNRRSA